MFNSFYNCSMDEDGLYGLVPQSVTDDTVETLKAYTMLHSKKNSGIILNYKVIHTLIDC